MKKSVLLIVAAALLAGISGCSIYRQMSETNDFASYSQEEKKEYIAAQLQERYQISCEFSEVEKRPVDVFRQEEDYFTTAHTETGDRFNIWIDDDGKMTDTYRLIMEQEQINAVLAKMMQSELSGYAVLDFPIMEEKPEQEWFDEEIEEAMKAEGMNHLICLLAEDVQEEDFQVIERVFADLDGNVYLYETAHPEQFSSYEQISSLDDIDHIHLDGGE